MKIFKKTAMSVVLSGAILMTGCSSQSEEEIYGMTVEELNEKAVETSQRELTEEEKILLTEEESKELEVGTFVERMPDRATLNKEGKDFMCVLHMESPDLNGPWMEYEDTFDDINTPYLRDYYLEDEANNVKVWCIGYIIYESKVEEFKEGAYVRYLLMPEEYGDKETKWIPVKKYNSKEDLDN